MYYWNFHRTYESSESIEVAENSSPFSFLTEYDSGPSFDLTTPREVTVLVGKTAFLSCSVRNRGNKTVSWIRHRDVHILTVGRYTYTSDQRFTALHHRHNDEWTLQIKYCQARDSGLYECQINTQPHRSLFVNLNVIEPSTRSLYSLNPGQMPVSDSGWANDPGEWVPKRKYNGERIPKATILGGPDVHVDHGSRINLTCIIQYSPEPPAYVFWYHHDQVLSLDSPRGGISILTEKGPITTSSLLIQKARVSDTGKYSCSPSNADVSSVNVHVLNGEKPAAMQSGTTSYSDIVLFQVAVISLILLLTER
ncbi:zwei Ig domain protein zig-8-like isoform X2 [Artemia franciscana]|uniref:zwei Ig domain protein zig-8-like isoform X2 n=1 Tax=Artemia franciscana TaxID=6661 RepID=UPI0032DAF1B0